MKKVVQDLTSGGIDWQREKWQSGLGSKFIHQGEKNAAKYADEVIVLSKGVQDYFKETPGCTFVFNKALMEKLKQYKPSVISINHRQHPGEFEGASAAYAGRFILCFLLRNNVRLQG